MVRWTPKTTMTTTPVPMDKLDAAVMAAVSGPADDPLPVERIVGSRVIRPDGPARAGCGESRQSGSSGAGPSNEIRPYQPVGERTRGLRSSCPQDGSRSEFHVERLVRPPSLRIAGRAGECPTRGRLATRAVAMLGPRPAAGPALALLQLLLGPPNAALSGSRLPGILDPATGEGGGLRGRRGRKPRYTIWSRTRRIADATVQTPKCRFLRDYVFTATRNADKQPDSRGQPR